MQKFPQTFFSRLFLQKFKQIESNRIEVLLNIEFIDYLSIFVIFLVFPSSKDEGIAHVFKRRLNDEGGGGNDHWISEAKWQLMYEQIDRGETRGPCTVEIPSLEIIVRCPLLEKFNQTALFLLDLWNRLGRLLI